MAKQALEGLKVVDFGWVIAGPQVGIYFAHHGATVIRVESMHRVDVTRTSMPYKDNKPGINRCGVFDFFNSNKLGMGLNLSHPRGVEVAKRLVAWGDVVGENFAPGVMRKLGLNYEELKKVRPDIIMYSSSNLGQTGPEAGQPGLGVQLVSYSGFTSLTGWPDRMPVQPYGVYTDFPAPRLTVAAVLAALEYRRRTGKGQYLDISQMEAGIHFLAPAVMDYAVNRRVQTRNGNRCDYAAPHGAYPCKGDDRWCAIAVFSDEEWAALRQVMGNPGWARAAKLATLRGRKKHEDELDERLAQWTKDSMAEEVMEKLQAASVPAGVVKNAADIQDDPQLAYRHYFWSIEHPEIGMHHYDSAGGCILSKTPEEVEMPSPLLGQHTEYICREILGMSDAEFIDLLTQGVFE
ncbi:CaiB/BaiF CoA transferase family protein [Chloroflexota bacterium]